MKNKIISAVALFAIVALPLITQADVVSLQPLSAFVPATVLPVLPPSPLSCFDIRNTLKVGSSGYEVRGLQFDLMKEGSSIPVSEYGTYGDATLAAVNAFQLKYSNDVLKGLYGPTGLAGKATRAKLNSLYGCAVAQMVSTTNVTSTAPVIPASVILNVKNVSIDSSGVTAVFCNQSPTDIPAFPVRVRLNGIIRDFNVAGALKAGVCDTDTIPFATWGLTYDPGVTFGVVTSLDPNSMYKSAQIAFPLTATTTLVIPAIQGSHLAVRGISIKSNGIQGTMCNLSSSDTTSFPVRIIVNGTSKDVDVAGLHTHGICQTVTWTWDMFGLVGTSVPVAGSIINATVNIDPNNIINEVNEFDNSATIVGSI